ncbi:hypothetical protein ACJIZ3_008408 [Penstemon smallii]|uniref:DUF7392 domain-containing protein n=1 Tax=Penstemon smallii TaxID=265156 RepID=A0ABD3T9N3_9LAMI
MACYVPFNDRNLDLSVFVFRPTVVFVDVFVEALKQYSFYTENLGCVHSSVFKSIHGNMVIWYGAWNKRSNENKQMLTAALLSILQNVASMATLIYHCFFDAYAGESKDGTPAAKFFTGDIISLNSATLSPKESSGKNITYPCLALFKDRFHKMDGATAGVCLRSQSMQKVVGFFVWKSLQCCYSYILKSDYRKTVLPYLDDFALDVKYDVFRVTYVSGDNVVNVELHPRMLRNEVDKKNEVYPIVQD